MIEKRRSRIQGWGVFATRPITKNTRIIDYAGEKITNRESLKREKRYLRAGPHLVLQAQPALRARRGGRRQRRALHQPRVQPNCYAQVIGETIWIRAARNIRKGEELTYDYYDRGRRVDPVPLPAGLQGHALMHVLYLHGFASSAQSSKAAFFRARSRRTASRSSRPDFNLPDFSTLTVTRMLAQVRAHDRRRCRPGP